MSNRISVVKQSQVGLGGRVKSIDAYRGVVMLLMMGSALSLRSVSTALPESGFWRFLAHHQTHADWLGCTLHDLIQPGFSFLVGVVLPLSLARRLREGESQWRRTLHAFTRAALLVLLGVFLRSRHHTQTNWTFEDTLSQIGLGYGFLYLVSLRSTDFQVVLLTLILVAYWLFFALYPLPHTGFDWAAVGTTPDKMLPGFAGHWSLNTNPAAAFDRWFLNLFPRSKFFRFNSGGYCTLSFIPTLGTMMLGLFAGKMLRSAWSGQRKTCAMLVVGVVLLVAGWGLGAAGLCPVVKKIWTPGWVLFSGGWSFIFLATFYQIVDVWGKDRWFYVPIVVGMNSIAAYMIAHLWVQFIRKALVRHLGSGLFLLAGAAYEPLLLGFSVLVVEWAILWWMYRKGIFLRV